MSWVSAAAVDDDLDAAVDALLVGAHRSPAPPGGFDLAFLFVGAPHGPRAEEVARRVREGLPCERVVGCTAGGVIGGGHEHEGAPALSLLAGSLPGTAVGVSALRTEDLPDADASPSAWHALLGTGTSAGASFVVLADPTTIRPDVLLAGLDFAWPGAPKVGGLASGSSRPGEQVLFAGDRAVRDGAVVVTLSGRHGVAPAVAQGCRAFGPVARITSCEGHLLRELDGVPAVEALRAALSASPPRDRELARTSLFLGFETDPFRGGADDDAWLVRNLAGADRAGGLYVGETLRVGRRVRFQVRDGESSAEDLDRTLRRACEAGPAPEAALLFSCLGRGTPLYGVAGHDSLRFRERFGDVPLGGFFCAGEIGPIGGTTHLHGYTSSFGLLRARDPA